MKKQLLIAIVDEVVDTLEESVEFKCNDVVSQHVTRIVGTPQGTSRPLNRTITQIIEECFN